MRVEVPRLDWINWFVLDTQHTISLIIYTPVVFDYRLRAQLWSPPSRLCLPRVCLLVVGLSAELKQKLLKGFPKNLDEWWVSDQNRTHLVPILIKVLIQELSLTFQDLAFFFFYTFQLLSFSGNNAGILMNKSEVFRCLVSVREYNLMRVHINMYHSSKSHRSRLSGRSRSLRSFWNSDPVT